MNRHCIIALVIAAVGLSSCKSHKSTVVRPSASVSTVAPSLPRNAASNPAYSNDTRISKALVKQARSWIGTPYRYGGSSKSGTDCSGMLTVIFKDVAKLSLPRNSAAQQEYCFEVPKRNLEPGDLVFFTTSSRGGKVNHVGMYVGNGKIIHASSSRGVIESSLDEKYYVSHYHSSGRVYGITYAATGGRKSGSADVNEVLLASGGLKADVPAPTKKSSGKSSKKSSKKSSGKSSVKSGAEAVAAVSAVAAAASSSGRGTEPVVEMTLDQFVAMRQQPAAPLNDTVIIAEQVIEHTVETIDSASAAVDSVEMRCAVIEPDTITDVAPVDTVTPAPVEIPAVMVNGKPVKAVPVDKRPVQKPDSVAADTVRQAEEIRETVVKAMKFGK